MTRRVVADDRDRVPSHAQVGEPGELGVLERDLVYRVVRELEHARAVLDGLDDEREHVEGSPRFGRPPPALG